ncbi:TetR/AcrR family transcriptional regulator [Dactylosporangium salmoneum]
MSPRREPVSRRDRPAKPPLSRAALVGAALRIMRDEGLERVTMRRLAAELDTGPAALYVYVRNAAELHGALLDALLADLPLPGPGTPSRWRDDLVELLCAYTSLLIGHPSLARSVLLLRPYGPNFLRLFDTLLGLLRAGGVRPRPAAWGVDLLLQHATATAAEQGTRSADAATEAAEEQALATAIAEADAAAYPQIAHARDELLSGPGEERLRWSLTAMIDGIAGSRA